MNGLKKSLIRIGRVILAAVLCVLLAAIVCPHKVIAPAAPNAATIAEWDCAVALEAFGAVTPRNHCTILFGGVSVRPDRAVLVRIRHVEGEVRFYPRDAALKDERRITSSYAWIDMSNGLIFITDRYNALSRRARMATLFHEVRGHWELRLSDAQMQGVLCPPGSGEDTHCITSAILRGCPTVIGKTTEQVYRIALSVGPFLNDSESQM